MVSGPGRTGNINEVLKLNQAELHKSRVEWKLKAHAEGVFACFTSWIIGMREYHVQIGL